VEKTILYKESIRDIRNSSKREEDNSGEGGRRNYGDSKVLDREITWRGG